MKLDVRHLRLVVTVADAGSLSEAARVLGVSQPTVSTQLRRIEKLLDSELFVRSAQGVQLTEQGVLVLRRARAALEHLDRLQGPDARPATPATVRVRTFVLPFEVLLPLLGPLVPGVRWEIAAGQAEDGLAAVADGSADLFYGLGIEGDVEVPDGVEIVEVVRERSWVLLPGDHPLAVAPTVSLADLAGSAWVCRPEAGLLRRLRQDCRRAGFEPDVQFRSVDTVAMMAVIESGAAVGLASPLGDRSGSVVLRPCPDTGEYAWILAHRRGRLPAEMIRTVWELIRWAYRFRAQQNPEFFAMLPAEIRDAALPAPFTS